MFAHLDREQQQGIISGLEDLGRRGPKTLKEYKQEFNDLSPLDQLVTMKGELSKRESKMLEKEK